MNILIVIVIIWFLFELFLFICAGFICHIKRSRKKLNQNGTSDSAKQNHLEQDSIISRYKQHIMYFLRGTVKYTVYVTSRIPSHTIRNYIYKYVFCISIKSNATIYFGSEFRAPYNIEIGAGSIIGDNCLIDGRCGVSIGENVNLSSEVRIWTLQHDMQDADFCSVGGSVKIGDRAWISSNVIILPSVTVGEGAVIAAGAVVTRDCEPYTVYGGVPAKKISERSKILEYNFNGNHDWYL